MKGLTNYITESSWEDIIIFWFVHCDGFSPSLDMRLGSLGEIAMQSIIKIYDKYIIWSSIVDALENATHVQYSGCFFSVAKGTRK